MKATNTSAKSFKALHVPGNPLLLVNVHDVASARLIAALPQCTALATGSLSVALANGTEDAKLTLETQLEAAARIAAVAREHANKPLTVDLQDGYGSRLEEAVAGVIGLGAVGINLEDSLPSTGEVVTDADEAADRIRRAAAAATAAGVEDFVINARADSFFRDGDLDEAIRRSKLYLAAGATTAFIIGHQARECTRAEVQRMVAELDGRVNVILRLPLPDRPTPTLTTRDLAELGVSRVSIGPQLYYAAIAGMQSAANLVFEL